MHVVKMNKRQASLHILFFAIVFHFLFPANAKGKQTERKNKVEFLFIEWKDKEGQLLLGHYESKSKKIIDIACSPETLTGAQLQSWLKGDKAILLFHCMWGQQSWFHKVKYLNTFDELFESSISNDVVVISFLWHAGGINYKSNWNKSFDKGANLSGVLQKINQFYAGNTSVLCHSMGSRFFEGAVNDSTISPVFQEVILFSSDISSSTADKAFMSIVKSAKQVRIFKHRKDKMLLLSSQIHGNKRIGRTGPEPGGANITVYDMTDHIRGFPNHAHINRRWAKEQLKKLLQ
jgi:hypothetical protein